MDEERLATNKKIAEKRVVVSSLLQEHKKCQKELTNAQVAIQNLTESKGSVKELEERLAAVKAYQKAVREEMEGLPEKFKEKGEAKAAKETQLKTLENDNRQTGEEVKKKKGEFEVLFKEAVGVGLSVFIDGQKPPKEATRIEETPESSPPATSSKDIPSAEPSAEAPTEEPKQDRPRESEKIEAAIRGGIIALDRRIKAREAEGKSIAQAIELTGSFLKTEVQVAGIDKLDDQIRFLQADIAAAQKQEDALKQEAGTVLGQLVAYEAAHAGGERCVAKTTSQRYSLLKELKAEREAQGKLIDASVSRVRELGSLAEAGDGGKIQETKEECSRLFIEQRKLVEARRGEFVAEMLLFSRELEGKTGAIAEYGRDLDEKKKRKLADLCIVLEKIAKLSKVAGQHINDVVLPKLEEKKAAEERIMEEVSGLLGELQASQQRKEEVRKGREDLIQKINEQNDRLEAIKRGIMEAHREHDEAMKRENTALEETIDAANTRIREQKGILQGIVDEAETLTTRKENIGEDEDIKEIEVQCALRENEKQDLQKKMEEITPIFQKVQERKRMLFFIKHVVKIQPLSKKEKHPMFKDVKTEAILEAPTKLEGIITKETKATDDLKSKLGAHKKR
ncbi:MAG: uncharacterized protein A8A55_2242 [Amphiamblys sp. WSBS2006]|nr:MAG: uncharacterized protein A8A55_2242 [Amphiamblys sp. WSBS2006]